MASSFEKINYTIRPNKSIERKMLCEVFGKLSHIDALNNFRYIGFGSPYFVDFVLLHRNLGIENMVSIEIEENKKDRFEFNLPYANIKMKYGDSSTILPNLSLGEHKNIVWLDYDDKFSNFMIEDINTFFFNAKVGSFFVFSVNVEHDFLTDAIREAQDNITLKEYRLQELKKRIEEKHIPIKMRELNFSTKNLIELVYEVFDREKNATLSTRNHTLKNKISFKQVINFEYKDNATILTIGGLLIDDSIKDEVNKMEFEALEFFNKERKPYTIKCPNLTLKEIKALDNVLPSELEHKMVNAKAVYSNELINKIPVPHADIVAYSKIYRYYPNFHEVTL